MSPNFVTDSVIFTLRSCGIEEKKNRSQTVFQVFEIVGGTGGGEQRLRRGFVSSTPVGPMTTSSRTPREQRLRRGFVSSTSGASVTISASPIGATPAERLRFFDGVATEQHDQCTQRSNACGEASFLRPAGAPRSEACTSHGATPAERLRFFDAGTAGAMNMSSKGATPAERLRFFDRLRTGPRALPRGEQRLRRGFVSSTCSLGPRKSARRFWEQRLRRGFVSSTPWVRRQTLQGTPLEQRLRRGFVSSTWRGLHAGIAFRRGATPAERLRFFDHHS